MVIWEQVIGERSTLVFPRDEVVELDGVVLEGSVDVTPMEGKKATTVGGPWSAFRAPGGGVTLSGTGGRGARAALVVVLADPAAKGAGLAAHLDRRDKPGAPASWAWKVRRRPVVTLSFESRDDLVWGGGAYHARIGWEGQDHPAAALDLLRFSTDAGVAEHVHDHEWESLAVLEGDGELVRGPADREERIPLRSGSIVTVPAGERHAYRPSGAAPLLAVQVYAPPGPEQRFKALAGKAP
jgi:mannose-6-phosphate isomerase-like protein (cupin superfamily)